MLKQYFLVRKDLGMSKGRIASQVAHSAIMCLLSSGEWNNKSVTFSHLPDAILNDLKKGQPFTKVVLSANSETEFYDAVESVKGLSLPFYVMIDNGFYDSNGVEKEEATCLAIGPCEKLQELEGFRLL